MHKPRQASNFATCYDKRNPCPSSSQGPPAQLAGGRGGTGARRARLCGRGGTDTATVGRAAPRGQPDANAAALPSGDGLRGGEERPGRGPGTGGEQLPAGGVPRLQPADVRQLLPPGPALPQEQEQRAAGTRG